MLFSCHLSHFSDFEHYYYHYHHHQFIIIIITTPPTTTTTYYYYYHHHYYNCTTLSLFSYPSPSHSQPRSFWKAWCRSFSVHPGNELFVKKTKSFKHGFLPPLNLVLKIESSEASFERERERERERPCLALNSKETLNLHIPDVTHSFSSPFFLPLPLLSLLLLSLFFSFPSSSYGPPPLLPSSAT